MSPSISLFLCANVRGSQYPSNKQDYHYYYCYYSTKSVRFEWIFMFACGYYESTWILWRKERESKLRFVHYSSQSHYSHSGLKLGDEEYFIAIITILSCHTHVDEMTTQLFRRHQAKLYRMCLLLCVCVCKLQRT